jgi:16S rRNA pseudouridine516 synthase
VRLDKFLHDSAGLSRKLAKKAVRDGRVRVGAREASDPAHHVAPSNIITLDGAVLPWPSARYLMLHKPPDCICATRDPHQRTVIDLLPPDVGEHLLIAGRLDIDATGLLLLSDDGQWIHRVTSPRHAHEKVYLATLAEPLIDAAERRFARGILLEGENARTLPALLERLSDKRVRVTLTEGRYHQVKRMFGALGNRVTALHREKIGGIRLDPELEPGNYRELTTEEVAAFGN